MSTPSTFPTYPDLSNKVALITGIGQVGIPNSTTWGNGAATARLLTHNRVKIFGCDLNLSAAERTKARLLADYPEASVHVVACDVTSASQVEATVQECLRVYGRIDICVNNVGMTARGDPGDMSEEVWDAQIALNLKSVFLVCRAVLPVMDKQGGGSVVNNASITALRYIGKPQIAYGSAKAAVLSYTRHAGVMYAAKGIRVNAVVPGLMYTPLVENLLKSERQEDVEVGQRIVAAGKGVPAGRMGSGEDVAGAVAFLCSDSGRYVVGHALVVDGGSILSTGVEA